MYIDIGCWKRIFIPWPIFPLSVRTTRLVIAKRKEKKLSQ